MLFDLWIVDWWRFSISYLITGAGVWCGHKISIITLTSLCTMKHTTIMIINLGHLGSGVQTSLESLVEPWYNTPLCSVKCYTWTLSRDTTVIFRETSLTALVTQTPGARGQRSHSGHSDSTQEPRRRSRRWRHSTFQVPGAQQSGECSGILKCGSGIPLKSKHFVAERKSCREDVGVRWGKK